MKQQGEILRLDLAHATSFIYRDDDCSLIFFFFFTFAIRTWRGYESSKRWKENIDDRYLFFLL